MSNELEKDLESGMRRKRTRMEVASASTTSTATEEQSNSFSNVVQRASKISSRLYDLYDEFPEMKYIINYDNLQEIIEAAVVKKRTESSSEEEANSKTKKKSKAPLLLNKKDEIITLFSLPDEVLKNCLSFVGKGHYGSVALASEKLYKTYKAGFGQETANLEMATSVNLANHCLGKLCKSLEEKDEILKAAAVNGNIDILRAAVKDGYDLFPLAKMYYISYHRKYSAEEDELKRSKIPVSHKVNLDKLVERGHLHVLKYLYEEAHYCLGLERYRKPAIEHGQLDILQFLKSIARLDSGLDVCKHAVKSGKLEVLKWHLQNGFWMKGSRGDILADAISSKSLQMIKFCFDRGHNDLQNNRVQEAIKCAKSVEVYHLIYELGYQFEEIQKWCSAYDIGHYFEIVKFLHSISIPWDSVIMLDFVEFGTLEMVRFAHENGYPWSKNGGEYDVILWRNRWSFEKLDYLIEHGCLLDYKKLTFRIQSSLAAHKNLKLLEYFVGKNSSFDKDLFKRILNRRDGEPWFEGISYLLQKGSGVTHSFKSIEEVFHHLHLIDGIKYFHSLGLPWCLDESQNNHLLSKIACYNNLDDVKWVYEHGCKGGNLVPFVKEEWKEGGIRHQASWKANQAFFEQIGMLEEKILAPTFVQDVGDAQLESRSTFFKIDLSSLKSLVDHGYTFRSRSERDYVTVEAFKACCENSENKEHRKRLEIIQQIGLR
ncbi:hypothetical protein CTEN210_12015 [Chaetoceros tenuissimus]|uniref:Uncharacterized protein n=1 Tax=Chaetoceros tenuissimus TaxID=426638 RepID=A0AAD3D0Q2_9STRA|nr:hypothetical protein CTEN210_12015 [Chaetoceros tenuissimus]